MLSTKGKKNHQNFILLIHHVNVTESCKSEAKHVCIIYCSSKTKISVTNCSNPHAADAGVPRHGVMLSRLVLERGPGREARARQRSQRRRGAGSADPGFHKGIGEAPHM